MAMAHQHGPRPAAPTGFEFATAQPIFPALAVIRHSNPDRVTDLALAALAQYFELQIKFVAGTPPRQPTAWIERLYRRIDALLYPQARPAASAHSEVVETGRRIDAVVDLTATAQKRSTWPDPHPGSVPLLAVSFDGLPLAELVEAVRSRIGQLAGTVLAEVWLLPANGPAELLFSGHCCIDHRSLARSTTWVAAKLPALIVGALGRLHSPQAAPVRDAAASTCPPLMLLADLARRMVLRLLFRDQWFIELHQAIAGSRSPGRLAQRIVPTPDRMWADPFLIHHNGVHWLLFEEEVFGAEPANISAMALDEVGRPLGPPQVVLRQPGHLSYPFIWRGQDPQRLLMIPESSADRHLSLYGSESVTGPWRQVATLMQGRRWADPTVVEYGGRWWLFATSASDRACLHDELWAYHSDKVEGPWLGHAMNPVKIDAGCARPAGAMWVGDDGALYRIGQDCRTVYGGAVVMMRVDVLTPDDFAESPVGRTDPALAFSPGQPWHTLNSDGQLVAVDLLRRRPRWRLPAWQGVASRLRGRRNQPGQAAHGGVAGPAQS